MHITRKPFKPFAGRTARATLIAALLAALALSISQPQRAAADSTIVVDSTADTTVSGDGDCTLREAILNANADADTSGNDCAAGSGADTITFSINGTIELASRLPNIEGQLALNGPGAANLTISGKKATSVLFVLGNGNLSLDGLTIANGSGIQGAAITNFGLLHISNSAFSGNTATGSGGAIYHRGPDISITDSTFSGNSSGQYGGGIYSQPPNQGSRLYISGTTFTGNTAGAGGGGIAMSGGTLQVSASFTNNSSERGGGVYAQNSATIMTSSSFTGNGGTQGGAVYYGGAGDLEVDITTFSENTAGSGGGIFNQDGTLTVRYSTFTNNHANTTDGGGITSFGGGVEVANSTFSGNSASAGGAINAGSPLTVSNSTFSDNPATNSGGAIVARDQTTIAESTFSGNSATRSGGGLWMYVGATVLVRNSTFNANSSPGTGGGLTNEGGALTLLNSTIANNTADSGGGIENRNGGSVMVVHSTLSGNSAARPGSGIENAASGSTATLRNTIVAGSSSNCTGTIANGGNNIDDGASCAFGTANGSKSSTNLRLSTAGLQFNGGTTKTIVLQTTSPAVNMVPLADCTDQNGAALTADQRGAGRPYGPACDAGAYELQEDPTTPPVVADLSLTQSPDHDPALTGEAVTFTLTAKNNGPDAAQNVVITEQMQQFATFVSASAGCTYASASADTNAAVTCSIGSLAAGASASVNVAISVPFNGAMVVFGIVSSSTNDPAPTNNSSTASVTVNLRNQTPTGIALSNSSVAENSPLGTAVGTLSTTDPDAGDTHTYTLVPNSGDNAAFSIDGDTLKTNTALDFETKNSYTVSVRSTDAGGLSLEKVFTITITDVVEHTNTAPTIAVTAGGSVNGASSGTMNLAVADADGDLLTLSASTSNTSLVPNGNISFGVSGANRTIRITALAKKTADSATVTVTVNDGQGGTATTAITVKVGSSKKETLTGTSGADMLFGLGGNDTISAGAGNDLLAGGDGNDTLTGGLGADTFSGGAGKDSATDLTPSQGDTQDGTIP